MMTLYDKVKTYRNIDHEGITLIKNLEGYRSRAYLDSANIATIGYGSTRIFGRRVRIGDHITEQEAKEQLAIDLIVFESAVNRLVDVYITQSMYNALVSFVYNVGVSAFEYSTLLKKLNNKDYIGAANEFDAWIYAGGHIINGLKKRRQAEKELFLTGVL